MGRQEIVSFNAIRGIAALAVCASHLRAFLFVKFPAAIGASHADKLFYFLTGLGHQSVIVFFVMSGWLVGNSVWQQQVEGRFSPKNYAIARLSRLLVVLIPALAFTLGIDSLGTWLAAGDGYNGNQHAALLSVPGPDAPLSLSALTLLGNILFLQTILVPVLGTNGPLWSLANEFWYYVAFPLFAAAWHSRTSRRGMAFATVGLTVLVFLPMAIRAAFVIWIFGWLGSMIASRVSAAMAGPLCALSTVLLFIGLAASKLDQTILLDIGLALAVTMLLVGLRSLPAGSIRFPRLASMFSHLAQISFTLYLFHFPLLAFLFFSSHLRPQQPSTLVYGEFTLLLASVLAITTCLWYLFERQTDLVRRYASQITQATSPAPQTAGPNPPTARPGHERN